MKLDTPITFRQSLLLCSWTALWWM